LRERLTSRRPSLIPQRHLEPTFLSSLSRDYLTYYNKIETSSDTSQLVDVQLPPGLVDVHPTGPYAVYNWELSHHIPIMIAVHHSQNQRFAEAQSWFHLVFDPTFTDSNSPDGSRYPYWKFLGFRPPYSVEKSIDVLSYTGSDPTQQQLQQQALDGYQQIFNAPFDPYAVARTRSISFMYYVVMKYTDNLIAWGDSLFLQNTPETINEARLCYVLAANLWGKRPQQLPASGTSKAMSYSQLKALRDGQAMDAMGNAMVDLEVQFPFNNSWPLSSSSSSSVLKSSLNRDSSESTAHYKLMQTLYFCFPANQKLLAYWDIIADRLYKVRHCQNIAGVAEQLPLFDPPIDPGMLVKAAAAGIDVGSVVSGLNQPASPVRSLFLIQKALEVANEVRSFGSALLSAFEKGENEHLMAMRQSNEIAVQQATQSVRYLQWRQTQTATQGLLRTRATVLERYTYYLRLLNEIPDPITAPPLLSVSESGDTSPIVLDENNFDTTYQTLVAQYDKPIGLQSYPELNLAGMSAPSIQAGQSGAGQMFLTGGENEELNLDLPAAQALRSASSGVMTMGGFMTALPDLTVNTEYWGIGASSLIFGGSKLAEAFRVTAEILQNAATLAQDQANRAGRAATYQRRADEWVFQANLAARELMQIGRQVITSLLAERVAYQEYAVVRTQAQQSQDVLDYIQTKKFTNEQLYVWMQGQMSALYYQYYRLAFDTARKTEQTMKKELMRPELDDTTFVQFNYWNTGYKGLLSGESLHLDLKRMELAYHENNKREFELIRHVSLRQLNPMAFLSLRTTGTCTFTIPEWLFDRECAGHYMRRIKSVALSIPSVVGPYASVNCTVTLQSSSIRTSSLLKSNNYARQSTDDDRFIDYFGSIDQVVTSGANNDSGLFEPNLRDERFLPFEGSGAINSVWKLELPSEFPPFDYNTISDAILHLRYTARQAGDPMKSQATSELKQMFGATDTSSLFLLFVLQNDFPTEWAAFAGSAAEPANFNFRLRKEYFPYAVQTKKITVNSLLLYGYDTKGPRPDNPQPAVPDMSNLNKDVGYVDVSLQEDPVLVKTAEQVFLVFQYAASS
jgi:Tc toxin complex TcA C-terminal TcB-binding domain